YFQQAITSNPIYPKSYLNAGVIYQTLGRAEPAAANFNAALRLDPNSVDVLSHLAYLLATCPVAPYHQPQQAIQLAQRTVQLTRAESAACLRLLAMTYASASQYDRATAAATQA